LSSQVSSFYRETVTPYLTLTLYTNTDPNLITTSRWFWAKNYWLPVLNTLSSIAHRVTQYSTRQFWTVCK